MTETMLEIDGNTIEGYSLSPQQKRLWKLQASGDKSYLRTGCWIRINGAVDVNLLKQAVTLVSDRHEILRTKFKMLSGLEMPLQVIEKTDLIWQEIDDMDNLDLPHTSSYRLAVGFKSISSNQHLMVLDLPALCCDRLGLINLVREIYEAYNNKTSISEPLQYADLSAWANDLLTDRDGTVGRNYWQQQQYFSEAKLPGEKTASYQDIICLQKFSWDTDLSIVKLAQDLKLSPETLMLAIWQTILFKNTSELDLVIGTYCQGRKYEELHSAIGLLAKYLPLSTRTDSFWTLKELGDRLTSIQAEADRWQEYFDPEYWQTEDRHYGFEFHFPASAIAGHNTAWQIEREYGYWEAFKLSLSCQLHSDKLSLQLNYNASLFDSDYIEQLAKQLDASIASAIAKPTVKIADLQIICDRDRQQLLIDFNRTQTPYPENKCFHQLFAERVAQNPDNIAAICGKQSLTYAELDQQANALASYLQSIGVGAEVLVGICAERSLELMVAILGILKAGGAYVPLDPAYPQEHIAYIIEDAKISVLLTQRHLISQLPNSSAAILCLDELPLKEIATNSQTHSTPPHPHSRTDVAGYVSLLLTPYSLAYTIYTSGSTGKPKGTLITHQGLVNYLSWCVKAYELDKGRGSCVHSSIAFDATITGLLAPLLTGRSVELIPEDTGLEGLSAALATNSDYNPIKISPAHLELLSQQISPENAAGKTRYFIIGGENLTTSQIKFWQEFAPETILVNEYGPTETVVGCCTYQISPKERFSGSIPIGRPIANTQIYILDPNLQPLPPGVPGEIYIGGAGLARGYLHRPELTAEKFIPHPFSQIPGERLYRTGDLARHLPDGNIEYLGRGDRQVKLRGYRLELNEIEAKLQQHPDVNQVAIILREDTPGDKRLVAYIVSQIPSLDVPSLRQFLQTKLPEYAIPSAFVFLKSLPLTINGKSDRHNLPAPETLISAADIIPPRNSIETELVAIWSEVLHRQQISITDNFFDLGGHSLLLIQVTSRILQSFNIEISLRQMFATPTIIELAETIDSLQQADSQLLADIISELQ